MKLGLLISGGLGYDFLKKIVELHEIIFVFTDKQSIEIINFSQNKSIPIFIGNPRKNSTSEFIQFKEIEVLLSVNYLYIIDRQLIEKPTVLALNIHGSLLPKYRGRTPHVWAIINNETKTGITAHLIEEDCDTGPIVDQEIIHIDPEDTGQNILEKFKIHYTPFVQKILTQIENKTFHLTVQNESEATYFGKRIPDNGRINWDWQKERIKNWVRAQSHPYPGAFCFINDNKIIIDEIAFNKAGYHFEDANGLVISINPILIKTSNGVVELKKIRNFEKKMQVGDILN